MVLLGFEGAETKGSAVTLWDDEYLAITNTTGTGLTDTPGRLGTGRYLKSVSNLVSITTRAIPGTPSTIIVGLGIRMTGQSTSLPILEFEDSTQVTMCSLRTTTDGGSGTKFQLILGTAGSVFLETAGFTATEPFWRYVQIKITFATGATGSAEIVVDAQALGTTTATNVQTSSSGTACAHLEFTPRGVPAYEGLDDMYWLDTTGPAPYNDFLGPVTTEALNPSGAGAFAEWTPNAGANWDRVDDGLTTDDDSTYVSTAALNITDTHVHTDLSFITGGVLAVKVQTRARNESVDSVNVRHVYRNGVGTNTSGPTRTVASTDYDGQVTIWPTNPDTGAAWTVTEIAAAEFGYETLA